MSYRLLSDIKRHNDKSFVCPYFICLCIRRSVYQFMKCRMRVRWINSQCDFLTLLISLKSVIYFHCKTVRDKNRSHNNRNFQNVFIFIHPICEKIEWGDPEQIQVFTEKSQEPFFMCCRGSEVDDRRKGGTSHAKSLAITNNSTIPKRF